MEVHLSPDHEAFILTNIGDGRFTSADEAVREAVSLLAAQMRETGALRIYVREGLEDLDAGNCEDFTEGNLHEFFDGVKRRGRERLAASWPL